MLLAAAGRGVSLRTTLVVAQFAAALVLVSGATLVARSVHAASTSTPGIDPDRIETMTKRVPNGDSGAEAGVQFVRTLGERQAAQPGVAGVAFSSGLELASMNTAGRVLRIDPVVLLKPVGARRGAHLLLDRRGARRAVRHRHQLHRRHHLPPEVGWRRRFQVRQTGHVVSQPPLPGNAEPSEASIRLDM